MNTTPTATGPILALDLGKYKTDACLYDPPIQGDSRLSPEDARTNGERGVPGLLGRRPGRFDAAA